MLKEVNHRVKNSLQLVSSILRLQMPLAERAGAGDVMRSASARVMAIAAVHERLYTGDDIRTVDLDSLLRKLCGAIAQTLSHPDGLAIEVEPVEVSTDMAVPVALVVNELVANAVKHAGPPCRVTLLKSDDGGFRLRVSDEGHGPVETTAADGIGNTDRQFPC